MKYIKYSVSSGTDSSKLVIFFFNAIYLNYLFREFIFYFIFFPLNIVVFPQGSPERHSLLVDRECGGLFHFSGVRREHA